MVFTCASLALVLVSSRTDAQTRRLSRAEAVRVALENNLDLKLADAGRDKASEKVREAKGALLPTITATGSYTRYLQKQVMFLPSILRGDPSGGSVPIEIGSDNSFNGALTLTMPILNWPAHAGVDAAEIGRDAAVEAVATTRAAVVTDVVKAYNTVLILRDQLDVQQQSVARNEAALADARRMLANGLAVDLDTLRAFVNLANLQPGLVRTRNQIEVATTNLKVRLGIALSEEIELTDSLGSVGTEAIPSIDSAYARAVASRPELRQLELNVRLAEAQLDAERAGHLPTLSGVGQVSTQSQSNDFDIGHYEWPVSSFLGVQFSLPIFTGFRTDSRTAQAETAVRENRIRLENTQRLLRAEVVNARSAVVEAMDRFDVQRLTVDAAERSYELTRQRMLQGVATPLEVTDAELALSQARMNLLQAEYDYRNALADFDRSTGRAGQ
jgi:outer membrane protein TolC